jgi:hypothetical protein
VVDYDSTLGIMEPFITPDGRFLLFNNAPTNSAGKSEDQSLHIAGVTPSSTTFQYLGQIYGVNALNTFDGGASLDKNNNIYFLSTRSVQRTLSTIYTGEFAPGVVTDIRLVEGVSPNQPGWLNMDAEISTDGRTLYYTVNRWNTSFNIPHTSDIQVARKRGRGNRDTFEPCKNSDDIMAAINTGELEYAPSLSDDELELFFTRAHFVFQNEELAGLESRILVATRSSKNKPFGEPQWINAITGVVEGSTITPDKKYLYYHKVEGNSYRLYVVTRKN